MRCDYCGIRLDDEAAVIGTGTHQLIVHLECVPEIDQVLAGV